MAAKLRPTRAFQKRLEFLHSGKLYFKDSVKIITLSYRTSEMSSRGLRYGFFMVVLVFYTPFTII